MTVRPAARRVRGVLAFLAIVWGVAASFVGVDMFMSAGALRLAQSGSLGTLALPAAVQGSRVCNGAVRDSPGREDPSPDASALVWNLGVRMGLHARAALMIVDADKAVGDPQTRERLAATRRMVDGSAAALERLSVALNVPRPPSFTPTRAGMANVDFVQFVEGETNQTARTLAARYGRDACELYKMGAYWGFSALVRAALPGEANIYSIEITHYARRIGVPESLWQPMVARTSPNADGNQLAAETDAATARITAYLRATPPRAGSGGPQK